MSELLPCPFCGKQPRKQKWQDYWNGPVTLGHIWCEECEISTSPDGDTTYQRAVEIWNRRAPDPRLAALVEAVSYGLSAFRKCVGLVAMIDGEGIIAVRAGRAALKRMDAALAALEGGKSWLK